MLLFGEAFQDAPPSHPHTHAHTFLTLSPFGPSFILIYEPPHGHSAVPSPHRSLKVDKKLSSRRAARMREGGVDLLPFVCEGTVAASDRTSAHPVQEGGCTTEGHYPRVPRPLMLQNHIKVPQENISPSVYLMATMRESTSRPFWLQASW